METNGRSSRHWRLLILVVLLLGTMVTGGIAFAGLPAGIEPVGPGGNSPQSAPGQQISENPDSKMSAELKARFAAQAKGAKVQYWVILKEQADTSNNIPVSRWADKGWYVYNKLTSTANSTQRSLLATLNRMKATGSVTEIESFWIINSIMVTGDIGSAQTMAADPLVSQVREPAVGQIFGGVEPNQLSPEAQVYLDWALAEQAQAPKEQPEGALIQHNISEVRAPQAWTKGYDGIGIHVSSMDTGVRHTHESLAARYRGTLAPPDPANPHDYNWYDGYLLSATPIDENGHGSHTMGTAVGGDTPSQGNIGVAKGAHWTTVRICQQSSCGATPIMRGFQWTLAPTRVGGTVDPRPDLRPRVSNNSWGGGGCDASFETAVNNWVNAGIFPDFANGNSGPAAGTVGTPANSLNAWGTGNLDTSVANWLIWTTSSRGPSPCNAQLRPHAIAPGRLICSAQPGSDNAYSCGYTGTSMAAPHIAGAVAVLLDRNENLTIPQLMFAITNTAFFSPTWGARPNNDYGWGLLQLDAAVNSVPVGATATPGSPGTATRTSTALPTSTRTATVDPCQVQNYTVAS